MNKTISVLPALALLCCTTTYAQKPAVFSGPQVGEQLPPLKVIDAFDTNAKAYDFVAHADRKPSILIFIHDLLANKSDEPSLGLAYVLSHYAATRKDSGLVRGVVFLTDDVAEMMAFLAKVRRALPKKDTPLSISPDGLEGPGRWGLNRNLRMTVVISQNNRVTANFALQQPSVSADAPRILTELVKVVGGKSPSLGALDFPYYIKKPADTEK